MTGAPVVLPLPGWRDPLEMLPLFAADHLPVLLYSGGLTPDREINRWSILGAGPFRTLRWSVEQGGDPFRMLAGAVEEHRLEADLPLPFAGGAMGFIGYEAGRAVEPAAGGDLKPSPLGGEPIPDMLFGLYAWCIVWDHEERRWWVVSTGLPASGAARRRKADEDAALVALRLAPRNASGASEPHGDPQPAAILGSSVTRDGYLGMVSEARRLISAGELYQVNLSQWLELAPPTDPVILFCELAARSPAPFAAYLDGGAFQVASASPERFVRLRRGRAECRPIKGTRPRGASPHQDARLREELAASPKDRAENVMIVDLMRNDLGRVCRSGSVRAEEICRLESYASVHHLVSIVSGDLAEDRGRADLLRALFPGGSMTGAPKVRAMRAIADLEPARRGIYAGALGYLSFCGAMDLSIVIRTAIVARDRTWLQVGGGVVADSDPQAEYLESLDKAASVRRALAAAGG